MSIIPANDAVYNRTDFVNNRRTLIFNDDESKTASIDGNNGLDIRYDIGTANVKNFRMSSGGINWTDNTNNHTTSLERLSLVQQALAAVELPPNATTLKINDTILVDAGVADQSTTIEDGKITINNASVGGSANPLLVLQNNTTTAGSIFFETYKNDLPTSTGGDFIGSWSATCNTNVGKTEIARINQICYGVGAANNDGGISLACKVNSTISTFLTCNGGVGSGEIQITKPITNPTGDITISTTSSSGTGTITLAPNTGASVLIPSEAEPTTDFISINPQIGADAQRVLMTATDAGTGFINSISLNNSQYAPSIELKADFGSPERSITITADGNISRNQITAFDSQANEPLQIISTNPTGSGAIEFKPDDSSGSLIFTSSALEFNGSSADSGKRLKITLNGVPYYIPLESV